ncbi:unnamed protein product [Orchesella dallaii]|uniref:Uncharacterized protein n=1 Tax=Orchesella dallaii TaxID=48710 RepID=A0ABP1PMG0_9HEXA
MIPISRTLVLILICWTTNIIKGNGISVDVKKVHRSGLIQVLSPSSPSKQDSMEGTNENTKRVNENAMLLVHLDALKEKIRFIGGGIKDESIRKGSDKVKSTLRPVQNPQDEIKTLIELEAKLREMDMNGRALQTPPHSGGSLTNNPDYPNPDSIEVEEDGNPSLKTSLSKVLDYLMSIIINLLELETEIMKNDKVNYKLDEDDDIIPDPPPSVEEGGTENGADGNNNNGILEVVLLPVPKPKESQEEDKDKVESSNLNAFPSKLPNKQNTNNNGSLEHLINVLTQLVDQIAKQSKHQEVVNPTPPKQSPDQIGTIFIPVIGNSGSSGIGGEVTVKPGGNAGEHQTGMDDNDNDDHDDTREDSFDSDEVPINPFLRHNHDIRVDGSRTHSRLLGHHHQYHHKGIDNHDHEHVDFLDNPSPSYMIELEQPEQTRDYPNNSPSLPVETTTSKTPTPRDVEIPTPTPSIPIAQEPIGQSFILDPLKPIMKPVNYSATSAPPPTETEQMTTNNEDYIYTSNYNCLDNEACSAYSSSQENCITKGCSFFSKKIIPICTYIHPVRAVGILFYEADRISSYYHSLQLKVSSECQNIPTKKTTEVGIGWDAAISDLVIEKDNIRVTLYDRPNCQGASYSPSSKLDDITLNFNDRTKSVRVCEESSSSTTCAVTFSSNPVSVILHETEDKGVGPQVEFEAITMVLTEECTNVPKGIKTKNGIKWSDAVSDVELLDSSNNMSLILYDDFNCTGNAYVPSQGPKRMKQEVATNFNDKTRSIRLCGYSTNPKKGSSSASTCFFEKNRNGYTTTFYTSPLFRGLAKESAQVLSFPLNPTCTDLPPQVIGSSNKMRPWNNKFISNVTIQGLPEASNNTLRVIVYERKGCQGTSYLLPELGTDANNYNNNDFLGPDFDKVALWQSAKICILVE